MQVSVVIPVLNEESVIADLVRYLLEREPDHIKEVIVVDGGSEDQSVVKAQKAGAVVTYSEKPGRAIQMNKGAGLATGDILYFLHADTYPPENFGKLIVEKVKAGYHAGSFRLTFDADHPLLNFYAWCTRFRFDAFRFGDQSLFVRRDTFRQIRGFNNDMEIMEDFEIIKRLKNLKKSRFALIDEPVCTSARRYRENGIIKLQLIFILIFTLYNLGGSQTLLKKMYQWLIKPPESD